jgi:hypothetical protein
MHPKWVVFNSKVCASGRKQVQFGWSDDLHTKERGRGFGTLEPPLANAEEKGQIAAALLSFRL